MYSTPSIIKANNKRFEWLLNTDKNLLVTWTKKRYDKCRFIVNKLAAKLKVLFKSSVENSCIIYFCSVRKKIPMSHFQYRAALNWNCFSASQNHSEFCSWMDCREAKATEVSVICISACLVCSLRHQPSLSLSLFPELTSSTLCRAHSQEGEAARKQNIKSLTSLHTYKRFMCSTLPRWRKWKVFTIHTTRKKIRHPANARKQNSTLLQRRSSVTLSKCSIFHLLFCIQQLVLSFPFTFRRFVKLSNEISKTLT